MYMVWCLGWKFGSMVENKLKGHSPCCSMYVSIGTLWKMRIVEKNGIDI